MITQLDIVQWQHSNIGNPELLPQRFPLSEGQIAIGPGLVDGDRLALQQTTWCSPGVMMMMMCWTFIKKAACVPECTWILSHQPAKYRKVWMDMPTCVLRASVYTAPESMDSMVASSSWCSSIRSASLGGGKGVRITVIFKQIVNSFCSLIYYIRYTPLSS